MALLITHRPALITLDLKMPRMNGWQVLEALRADQQLAAIPVFIVAGRSAEEAEVTGDPRDGDPRKPIDIDLFLAMLARVTGAKSRWR